MSDNVTLIKHQSLLYALRESLMHKAVGLRGSIHFPEKPGAHLTLFSVDLNPPEDLDSRVAFTLAYNEQDGSFTSFVKHTPKSFQSKNFKANHFFSQPSFVLEDHFKNYSTKLNLPTVTLVSKNSPGLIDLQTLALHGSYEQPNYFPVTVHTKLPAAEPFTNHLNLLS